jgi:hypothetical protein
MHYITQTLEGTSTNIKVAYIDDVTADVYGFAGESKNGLEAHDGGVLTTKV